MTAHTVVGHLDTGDTRACHGHTPRPTQNQSALDTLPYAQVVCAFAAREGHSPQRVAYRDVRSRTID